MFPFDRLIKAIDVLAGEKAIAEPIFAQIGSGTYLPKHFPFVDFMSRSDFKDTIQNSKYIVSHAGTGTISAAIKNSKPILIVPRQRKHNEHVDDHQLETARFYTSLGSAIMATNEVDIAKQLTILYDFKPRPRVTNPIPLVLDIKLFLEKFVK